MITPSERYRIRRYECDGPSWVIEQRRQRLGRWSWEWMDEFADDIRAREYLALVIHLDRLDEARKALLDVIHTTTDPDRIETATAILAGRLSIADIEHEARQETYRGCCGKPDGYRTCNPDLRPISPEAIEARMLEDDPC